MPIPQMSRTQRFGWAASLCGLAIATPLAAQEGATLREVVVTGSRIKRDDSFSAPIPLVVVDAEAINESGTMVLGDTLANMPQLMVNVNMQNSSTALFTSGQTRVDMRGLGSARTLVLVDGRRHLTGDFRTSSVDVNMVPSSMIERVEIISGGASAVYGSEAISGVANILLKRKLDGFTVDFQGGVTQEGDGAEYKTAFGFGGPFAAGRGSFVLGGEYQKFEPIYQRDRDWAYPGVRRDTTANPQTVITQSRSNLASTATFQWIRNTNNPNAERSSSIAVDRSIAYENSADCRRSTVAPTCQDPWLPYLGVYNALQGEMDRRSVRAYAEYSITDRTTVFADLSTTRVRGTAIFVSAFSNAGGGGTMPVQITGDNAYLNSGSPLANQLRAQWLNALPAGSTLTRSNAAFVGKIWEEFGMRNSDIDRESYRMIGGLQGDMTLADRKVDWNVYAQYSKLLGEVIAHNVPNIQRVQQAVDAVTIAGQIVCNDAAARAAGCQPWDLIHGPSPAAIAWANATASFDGVAKQTVFAANATMDVVDLPAGPLALAAGAEYRDEQSDQVQDALSASNALFYNVIGRTAGQYHIKEAYAEVSAPLARDLPALHRLSLEVAGRIGDYSSIGGVNQWRVQSSWSPLEDLSIRASQSIAVRAPNITELYSPQTRNFTTAANDPCDRAQMAGIANDPVRQARRIANCSAVIPGYDPNAFISNIGSGRPSAALLQGGNPDLSEETADAFTLGFIAKPRFASGLSIAFDYWKIELEDAINTIPVNTLLSNLCYDAAPAPADNRFCALIRRDASGASTAGIVGGVAEITLTQQNVQAIETSGYDFALQYAHEVAGGTAEARLDATKTVRWDLEGVPGAPITHFAGTLPGVNGSVPKYKAIGTLRFAQPRWNVQWQTRFQYSYAVSEVDPPSSRSPFYTGNYYEHDLRGAYELVEGLRVRAGIINLTNEHPPLLPEVGNAAGAASSTYDNRGRFYYAGVRYDFGAPR